MMTEADLKKAINSDNGAVPDFISGMVDDLEYIPRNERLGRAGRLKRKQNKKWLLAIALGAIVLVVVLAMAFDKENPPRDTVAGLEASFTRIEGRLTALEEKIAHLEERLGSEILEKKTALARSGSKKQYHTVVPGDSLSAIATKYGLTVDILCKLNRISVDQPIKPNQTLLVSPD
ncbi:MAG: LysM peptidoglycan-binding domain-containing protein [Deltaproteobacteria bacterium]|nr:LysM peptidoglycan-binding domain-containing protein [Deltaproteobacteria bacterium]